MLYIYGPAHYNYYEVQRYIEIGMDSSDNNHTSRRIHVHWRSVNFFSFCWLDLFSIYCVNAGFWV